MRICLAIWLGLLVAAGCGGDEPPAKYLERCEVPDDCEAELSCKLGRCTPHCSTLTAEADDVCEAMNAVCTANGCFPSCQGGAQCPAGLQCGATSQAMVQACQPPADEIPTTTPTPIGDDFGNAASGGSGGASGTSGTGGNGGSGGGAAGTGGTGGTTASAGNGASGLATERTLATLSSAEAEQLCSWARNLPGVGEEIDCGGGLTVTISVDGTCQSELFAECSATVAEAEACFLDNVARPCELVLDSCLTLLACSANLPSFNCLDGSGPIPGAWQCDGEPDCPDGSDEEGC